MNAPDETERPPGWTEAVQAAVRLAGEWELDAEPERVAQLRERASLFLSLCREAGLDTGASGGTPVVPVIVGDSLAAARMCELLLAEGINVQPMISPAVPNDEARLRFFVSSEHTDEQLREAVRATADAVAQELVVEAALQ